MKDINREKLLEKMSLIDPQFIEKAVYPEKASSPAASRPAKRRSFARIAAAAALIAMCGSVTAIAAGFIINHNTQKNYVESFAAESVIENSSTIGQDASDESAAAADVQLLRNPDSGNRLSVEGAIQDVTMTVENISRDDNVVQFEIRMDFADSVDVDAVRRELESAPEALGQGGYLLGAPMFFNTPQNPDRGYHTSYMDGAMIGSMDLYGLDDPIAALEAAYPEDAEEAIPAISAEEWDGWGEFRGDSLYLYPSIRWTVTAGEDISGTHTIGLEFSHLFFDGTIHDGTWKCTYEMNTLSYRDTLVLTPMDLKAQVGNDRRLEDCTLEEYAVTPNGVKIYGHSKRHEDLTIDFSGEDEQLRAVAWDDLGNYYVSYSRVYDHSQYKETFTSEKVWDTELAAVWDFGNRSTQNNYSGDTLMEGQGKTYASLIPEDAGILYVALEKETSHWDAAGKDYKGVDYELVTEPVEIHLK